MGLPYSPRVTYEWPNSVVSSRCVCRTSQILMVLSMDPVAMMQSLYLHQSAVRTSKACAGNSNVGWGCRKSHSRTVVSPDADRKTSPWAGLLRTCQQQTARVLLVRCSPRKHRHSWYCRPSLEAESGIGSAKCLTQVPSAVLA